MKAIEVIDDDFKWLQNAAKQLAKTNFETSVPELQIEADKISVANVVHQLIEQYEAKCDTVSTPSDSLNGNQILVYNETNIPNLLHAKLLSGSFGGKTPEKMTWNGLMLTALKLVYASSGAIEDLRRISGANVIQGKKKTDGYKYLPEQDFSYQGAHTMGAVKIIIRCANALRCRVHIEFEWRNKEEALHPGRRAVLTIE